MSNLITTVSLDGIKNDDVASGDVIVDGRVCGTWQKTSDGYTASLDGHPKPVKAVSPSALEAAIRGVVQQKKLADLRAANGIHTSKPPGSDGPP
jgi:hypothetical protein